MQNDGKRELVNEKVLVERLLGRAARVPYRVILRCGQGIPIVLQADPVFKEDGIWKPFPTVFWLACPSLRKELSALENEGKMMKCRNLLETDEKFRVAFIEGQEWLAEYRLNEAVKITGPAVPEYVMNVLRSTTVAGSRMMTGVKCLHAHAAQQLAMGNNPVGAEALASVGSIENCRLCLDSARKAGAK